MIPQQNAEGETVFLPKSGGAVFNTSIALGRLGIETGFISGLSNDFFGQQLVEDLVASQVDTRLLIRSGLPTTLAFVQLDNGCAKYTFYDEHTVGRMLTTEQIPMIPDDVDTLFFGGISLIGEPAADFYATLALKESRDKLIYVDPNIRSGFINNEDVYLGRLNKIIAHTDILKVSDEDLNWIIPKSTSLDEKVAQLAELGPSIILLTCGCKGASAYINGEKVATVPAKSVEVVDTVGAGDTFNAGVMTYLSNLGMLNKNNISELDNEQITKALEYGALVSSITVSRSGANPPWKNELS